MNNKLVCGFILAIIVAGVIGDFSFSTFSDSDNTELQYVSDAKITGNNLTITTAFPSKVGAAWYVGDVFAPVGEYVLPGFKTEFTFVIDDITATGGDGIAFVVQSDSPYIQGTIGAGIGYGDYQNKQQGIPESVAVEFDTVNDSAMNDPNDNHCGVHSVADSPNSSNENAVILGMVNTTIPQLQQAGFEHSCTITYDANTTSLVVELDGEVVLSSTSFNLTDYVPVDPTDGTCFVGFTASTTTTAYATHYITSWYFWSGNGTVDIPATIVYGPGLVSAELDDPAEFYVQLVDIYGFNSTASGAPQGVFPACNITDSNGNSADPCVMTDNNDGTYTASYTMTVLGDFDIFVTVNGEVVGTSPYPISISGPPYGPACTASGPGLSSTTAGETATFTITTFDAVNNPITSGGADFLVWLTGPQIANGTVFDNQDGTYAVTYNVTVSGDYTLFVQLDNGTAANIQDSPFSVTCAPNVVNVPTSYAYGDGLTNAVAGEVASFMIQTVDLWGNNATTPVITWNITLADDEDFYVVPAQTLVSPGLYNITYEMDDSGSFGLIVADGNTEIASSPFALTVVAGLPYAAECDLESTLDPTISTEIPTSIVIQAEDQFGNHIHVGGAVFTCTFTGPNNTQVTSTDNGDGTYVCDYTLYVPGTYTIAIDLVSGGMDTGPIEDSPFTQNAIGPAYGPACDATGAGLTSAVAGETATFTVALFDLAGSPATSGDDICKANLTGAANVPVTCVYSGNANIYSGSYTTNTAGNYVLNIDVNDLPINNSPFDVTAVAGPVSPGHCTASGTGLSNADAGVVASFTVTLRDKFGNKVVNNTDQSSSFGVALTLGGNNVTGTVAFQPGPSTYLAQYTLDSPTGVWNLDVTFENTPIQDSPFSVTLAPGPIFAAECFAFPDPLPDTLAYAPDVFQIQAVDEFGNNLSTGGSTFDAEFFLPDATSSLVRATTVSATSVYTGAGGLYNVPFTLNITGNYSVTVTLDDDIVPLPIKNSLLYIFVEPGLATGNMTRAIGPGLTAAVAGEPADFTIITFDLGGQPVKTGGANFSISMTMGNITVQNGTYVDNQDGTYSCSYTAFVAGTYDLEINLDSGNPGPIIGSPFHPVVAAGASCPQNATVDGPGLTNAETFTVAYFTIQSSDCYGNPIDDSDTYYDVLIEGPDCTFANVTYINNGLFNVTYIVNEPGNYSIVIQESGFAVEGSPFPLVVTGEGFGSSSSGGASSSSSSFVYMILMIIFIILFVIALLALIAYIVYDKKKKIKKFFKKHKYESISHDSD